MKTCLNLLLCIGLLLIVTACASSAAQTETSSSPPARPLSTDSSPNESIYGVFEGITPCSAQTRPLPQIPADTNCEQMIWKIVFYQDPSTGSPTTYALESAYGVPQPNTPGLAGGGTPIVMEGNWAIAKGTKEDPGALIYQLYSKESRPAVSFLKMAEDILHVLSEDQTLLVGNPAWSYTLNRTDNQVATQTEQPGSMPEGSRPPIPPMPAGSSVLGVFEGRLPCHEMVLEFTKVPPFQGCTKIKSRLTLYQDENTAAPTIYVYMGTTTVREGTWTIVKGTKSDPDAEVYQLQLEEGQQPVSFLKADENHLFLLDRDSNLLVGNALFSYTLSKIESATQ